MKKTTTTIEFNNEICTLEISKAREAISSKQKHSILYVDVPFSPEELKWGNITTQPPVSVKGKDPENDKAWRKYNKAEVSMERFVIQQAAKDGVLDEDFVKELNFSRKAGCSCGCSPGWKGVKDFGKQSIWLTLTSPSKEKEKQMQKEMYLYRKEAEALSSLVI